MEQVDTKADRPLDFSRKPDRKAPKSRLWKGFSVQMTPHNPEVVRFKSHLRNQKGTGHRWCPVPFCPRSGIASRPTEEVVGRQAKTPRCGVFVQPIRPKNAFEGGNLRPTRKSDSTAAGNPYLHYPRKYDKI